MLHFDLNDFDKDLRIEKIFWKGIPHKRPRIAGKTHGLIHTAGTVRCLSPKFGREITEGFGWSTLSCSQAELLIGVPVRALFTEERKELEISC